MIHIVLLEPEIPQNTGNISRTCAVTGAHLHLIGPMGFSIEDRWLKRAGLDYWDQLTVTTYENWADFKAQHPDVRPWMASSKAAHSFCDVQYEQAETWLLFGKETKGRRKACWRPTPTAPSASPCAPAPAVSTCPTRWQ